MKSPQKRSAKKGQALQQISDREGAISEEALHWMALNMALGAGGATFHRLVRRFGTPLEALRAGEEELASSLGTNPALARRIAEFPWEAEVEREIKEIKRHSVRVLTMKDGDYPSSLRSIHDPPPVIYLRGDLLREDVISIAMVGTRRPTNYGRNVASKIASDLAACGLTVVSGFARGIDTIAHRGALEAGGRTLAVLGCGADVIYPSENGKLMGEIIARGCVISEFPMGTKPFKGNFPMRNRLISGLTLGTLVVEAGAESGAMITARCALEQGREVFAVPGNVTSERSRGTNLLIKEGACLVSGASDLIGALPLQVRMALREPPSAPAGLPGGLSPEEQKVLSLIPHEEKHIDFIIAESGMPASKISGILVRLELAGLIKQFSGKMFVRSA